MQQSLSIETPECPRIPVCIAETTKRMLGILVGGKSFGKSLSRKLSILSSVQHNVCRPLDPGPNVTLECLGCMGSRFCPTTYNLKHKVWLYPIINSIYRIMADSQVVVGTYRLFSLFYWSGDMCAMLVICQKMQESWIMQTSKRRCRQCLIRAVSKGIWWWRKFTHRMFWILMSIWVKVYVNRNLRFKRCYRWWK